jgi:hypothetical protein
VWYKIYFPDGGPIEKMFLKFIDFFENETNTFSTLGISRKKKPPPLILP